MIRGGQGRLLVDSVTALSLLHGPCTLRDLGGGVIVNLMNESFCSSAKHICESRTACCAHVIRSGGYLGFCGHCGPQAMPQNLRRLCSRLPYENRRLAFSHRTPSFSSLAPPPFVPSFHFWLRFPLKGSYQQPPASPCATISPGLYLRNAGAIGGSLLSKLRR